MRFQIFLRDDLAKILNKLAWLHHRTPKGQAEWLLQKALEQAAHEVQSQPQEVTCVTAK